ncbi:hypothetical protein REPUB_Repub03eG0165200 [Reevesia pubescens]
MEDTWERSNRGSVVDRISACGKALRQWSGDVFGGLGLRIRKKMEEISKVIEDGGYSGDASRVTSGSNKLNELLQNEEVMLRQRAKAL